MCSAGEPAVRRRLGRGALQRARDRGIQGVVDERGLARARDAGDADEHAERQLRIHVLQVVPPRAVQDELVLGAAAVGWHGNRELARQVAAGERLQIGDDFRRRSLRHDPSARFARPRAHVDHVIGGADRLLVMLHHDDRIAKVAQLLERRDEARVVALVQADRRLIEHVHHSGQARADLASRMPR